MNNCKKCGYETTPFQIIRIGLCRMCENELKTETKGDK